MNLNKASLIGRVTRDPELKALPSGTPVVKLGLATNHTFKNKDGEKQESVQFHNLVAFGKLAEIISSYVKKGQMIYVDGRIEYRTWEKKDGGKGTQTEIVLENLQMGPRAAGGGVTGQRSESAYEGAPDAEIAATGAEEDINPDDIPF